MGDASEAEVGLEVAGEVLDEDDALEVLREGREAEMVGPGALGDGLGRAAQEVGLDARRGGDGRGRLELERDAAGVLVLRVDLESDDRELEGRRVPSEEGRRGPRGEVGVDLLVRVVGAAPDEHRRVAREPVEVGAGVASSVQCAATCESSR